MFGWLMWFGLHLLASANWCTAIITFWLHGWAGLVRGQHCRCRQHTIKRQNGLLGRTANRIGLVFIFWINFDGKANMAVLDHDS